MAHAKISQAKKTQKSDPQVKPSRHEAEQLAMELAQVLKSPACPQQLHEAIVECLSDIQSRNCCYNVDFLLGLILSQPRPVEEAEGGAQ